MAWPQSAPGAVHRSTQPFELQLEVASTSLEAIVLSPGPPEGGLTGRPLDSQRFDDLIVLQKQ